MNVKLHMDSGARDTRFNNPTAKVEKLSPFAQPNPNGTFENALKEARGASNNSSMANMTLETDRGNKVQGTVISQKNGESKTIFVSGQNKAFAIKDGYLVNPDGTRERIVGRESNDPLIVDTKGGGQAASSTFIDSRPTEFKAITSAPTPSPKSVTYEPREYAQQPQVGVAAMQLQAKGESVEYRTSDGVRNGGPGIASQNTQGAERVPAPEQLRGASVSMQLGSPIARPMGGSDVLGGGEMPKTAKVCAAPSVDAFAVVRDGLVAGRGATDSNVAQVREAAKASVDQLGQLVRDRGGMPGREAESMVADVRGSKEFLMKSATQVTPASAASPAMRGVEADVASRVKVGAERFVQVPEKMVAVREDLVRGERGVTANAKAETSLGERNAARKEFRGDGRSEGRGDARIDGRSVGKNEVRNDGRSGREDVRGGARNEVGTRAPQNGGTSMDVASRSDRQIGRIQDATKSSGKVSPKLDIALAVKLAEPKVKERVVDTLSRIEKVIHDGTDAKQLALGPTGKRVVDIAKDLGVEKVAALRQTIAKSENGRPPKFDGFDQATMEGYRKLLQVVVSQADAREAISAKGVGRAAVESVRLVGETVKVAVESVKTAVRIENKEIRTERTERAERKENGDQKVRDSEGLTMAERRLAFVLGLLSGIGFGARKAAEEKQEKQPTVEDKKSEDQDKSQRTSDQVHTLRTDRTLRNELKEWKGFWTEETNAEMRDSAYRAIYVVRKGDTLRSIALKHPLLGNVRLWELIMQINQLSTSVDAEGRSSVPLRVGEHILIPSHDDVVLFWAEKWLMDRKEERKAARICCLQCRKPVPGGGLQCRTCNSATDERHLVDTVLNVIEPKALRKRVQ